jgi:hypothetical protein
MCLLQDYPDFRQAESLKAEVDGLWHCGCTSHLMLLLSLLLLLLLLQNFPDFRQAESLEAECLRQQQQQQ